MEGIVIQLQSQALDESVDIETLLRKAYVVARKLQLTEFEEWISQEQNGYKNDVPDYRQIHGQIRAWNPYHGWIPVVMQGKMADMLSKMPVSQPIASISDSYNNSDGTIGMTVSGALTELLNENTDGFVTTYTFQSSKTELRTIISAVRNKILDWALLLEENGIVGNGLSFTDEERKKARESQTINNYTNNFYSSTDNTQIQQGTVDGKQS